MQASQPTFEPKQPDSLLKDYQQIRTIELDPDLLRERRIIITAKSDPRANIFRMLRTKVLNKMREKHWKTLVVTSARPNCGKTFVTANLAMALAMEVNQAVIVVDADLSHPDISWHFGFTAHTGLLDYLEENSSLDDIAVKTSFPRLTVIPGSRTTNQSSELLSSPRMANFLHELKSKYSSHIIIFDMPSLFACDDTLISLPYFDAALLVVENGRDTIEDIQRSIDVLKETNLLGTVLNKASTTGKNNAY